MREAKKTPTTKATTPAERGQIGGKKTAEKHGQMHMEAIGRAGFQTTVERYWGGDVYAYMENLRRRQGHKAEFDTRLGCKVAAPSGAV